MPTNPLHSAFAQDCGPLAGLCGLMLLFAGTPVAIGQESAKPLARCAVQTISGPTTATRSAANLPDPFVPDDGVSANYRLGRTGGWEVPSEVDRNDPHTRLVLLTPSGPVIVELAVSVDGRPFRTTREEWIDEALAAKERGGSDATTKLNAETIRKSPELSDDSDGADADQAAEPKGVSAADYEPSGARERLRQYVERSRISVGRDEARWLLAEWVPGPALLQLRPDFAADRARQAPLWAALDRDGDQRLTKDELRDVTTQLQSRDTNEDDWVDLVELITGRSPLFGSWTPPSLGTILSDATDWEMLRRQLIELYGSNPQQPQSAIFSRLMATLDVADPSSLTTEDLKQLLEVSPDVAVRIGLAAAVGDGEQTGVAVLHLSEPLRKDPVRLQGANDVIALAIPGCVIELAAAQRVSSGDAGWNAQIAVGTVLDGFPLLRLVDLDADHRLSLREIESLPDSLAALDGNADGEIAFGEVPVPIRLVVTLGPYAHEVLNRPAAASLIVQPQKTPAPDWFASMDENKDNDLTPAEFLGTPEQFDQLDKDRNGRVSAREAAKTSSLSP